MADNQARGCAGREADIGGAPSAAAAIGCVSAGGLSSAADVILMRTSCHYD